MPHRNDTLRTPPPRSSAAETVGLLAVAIAAAIGVFSQRPSYQHWDSLVYADLANRSLLGPSLYSVHVLPNALLYAVVQVARSLGLAYSALTIMQVVNAGVVAMTAAVLIRLGRNLGLAAASSLGFCLLLIGMRAYWNLAGTADLYAFIVLITIIAYFTAAGSILNPTTKNIAVAGIAGGLAVLSWQPHGLLLVTLGSLAVIHLRDPRQWSKWVLKYGSSAGITVTLGYGISIIASGLHSVEGAIGWVRGYFGNSAWGNRMGLSTLPTVIHTSTGALLSDGYRSAPYVLAKAITICLLLALTVLLLRSGLRAGGWSRSLALTTIGWATVTALASWWFDPASPKFWIVIWSVLLCTGMLLFARSSDGPKGRQLGNALVLTAGVTLAGFNYVGGVHLSHVMPNHLLQSMAIWRTHTEASDLLIVDFGLMPYLRYYLDRTEMLYPEMIADMTVIGPNAALDQVLRQRIAQATLAGNTVYRVDVDCASDATAKTHPWCSPGVLAVIGDLTWDHAFSYADGASTVQVWRLAGQEHPVGMRSACGRPPGGGNGGALDLDCRQPSPSLAFQ